MLPPRLWVVAYLRRAVTGGMPSPGTLCCARVPGYGRVPSLRDDGQCAWSVAHLRSAWLWGRPASPCAIRWARRANGVMWSDAPLARVSRLRCRRWCGMAGASEMRYYGIGGGKVIPYMCDVNVHYCIVGQVIFCLMILPNIKLLLTLHSI